MLVELVSLLNDDGLRLDGAFYAPDGYGDRAGPVDALLLIHGSRGTSMTTRPSRCLRTLTPRVTPV